MGRCKNAPRIGASCYKSAPDLRTQPTSGEQWSSFKYLYYALLFTTPYLVCSTALSGLYIFTLKARRTISPGRLPKYPDPSKRDDLFLVVGEVRNPRKPLPAKAPSWLTIPERGLFTGIAILGAIGSGKTSCEARSAPSPYPASESQLVS